MLAFTRHFGTVPVSNGRIKWTRGHGQSRDREDP